MPQWLQRASPPRFVIQFPNNRWLSPQVAAESSPQIRYPREPGVRSAGGGKRSAGGPPEGGPSGEGPAGEGPTRGGRTAGACNLLGKQQSSMPASGALLQPCPARPSTRTTPVDQHRQPLPITHLRSADIVISLKSSPLRHPLEPASRSLPRHTLPRMGQPDCWRYGVPLIPRRVGRNKTNRRGKRNKARRD
jgi:hypothetical protein